VLVERGQLVKQGGGINGLCFGRQLLVDAGIEYMQASGSLSLLSAPLRLTGVVSSADVKVSPRTKASSVAALPA
jgi:hypothetical protein